MRIRDGQFISDDDPRLPQGIREVTFFKTNDGHLSKSPEEAIEHIRKSLEEKVGKIIDGANKNLRVDQQLCTQAKIAVVESLVGTYDNAEKLYDILKLFLEDSYFH